MPKSKIVYLIKIYNTNLYKFTNSFKLDTNEIEISIPKKYIELFNVKVEYPVKIKLVESYETDDDVKDVKTVYEIYSYRDVEDGWFLFENEDENTVRNLIRFYYETKKSLRDIDYSLTNNINTPIVKTKLVLSNLKTKLSDLKTRSRLRDILSEHDSLRTHFNVPDDDYLKILGTIKPYSLYKLLINKSKLAFLKKDTAIIEFNDEQTMKAASIGDRKDILEDSFSNFYRQKIRISYVYIPDLPDPTED